MKSKTLFVYFVPHPSHEGFAEATETDFEPAYLGEVENSRRFFEAFRRKKRNKEDEESFIINSIYDI